MRPQGEPRKRACGAPDLAARSHRFAECAEEFRKVVSKQLFAARMFRAPWRIPPRSLVHKLLVAMGPERPMPAAGLEIRERPSRVLGHLSPYAPPNLSACPSPRPIGLAV